MLSISSASSRTRNVTGQVECRPPVQVVDDPPRCAHHDMHPRRSALSCNAVALPAVDRRDLDPGVPEA